MTHFFTCHNCRIIPLMRFVLVVRLIVLIAYDLKNLFFLRVIATNTKRTLILNIISINLRQTCYLYFPSFEGNNILHRSKAIISNSCLTDKITRAAVNSPSLSPSCPQHSSYRNTRSPRWQLLTVRSNMRWHKFETNVHSSHLSKVNLISNFPKLLTHGY